MKQHKTVNLNIKLKLSRSPSRKEKMNLVEFIAEALDGEDACLYVENFAEQNNEDLVVEHHYVTIRKMGVIR